MRPTKFMVWDEERKELAFVGAMDWAKENDNHPVTCNTLNNKLYKYYKELPIVQSTGTHDDKHKEVFEGHIVKLSHDEEYSNDQVSITIEDGHEKWELIGEVEFNSFMWLVHSKGVWVPLFDIKGLDMGIEIIGHRYTTPKLLEGK